MPAPLTDKPPVISADRQQRVADAKLRAEEADKALIDTLVAADAARAIAQKAQEEAEAVHAREHAEEIAWHRDSAIVNHDRHLKRCAVINAELNARRAVHPTREDGTLDLDPDAITTITLDADTHVVVERIPLTHGHKGHGTERREASRFMCGCGLSVDAPHDELLADRFVQGAKVSCTSCKDALTQRGEGLTKAGGPSFNPPVKRAAGPTTSEDEPT